MVQRKYRPTSRRTSSNRRSALLKAIQRKTFVETLEERRLLAVGPQLAGIQPNEGALLSLTSTSVRNVAPSDLTFRFDDNQVIDSTTLSGIRITRTGLDGIFGDPIDGIGDDIVVTPGFIGVGDAPNENEVVVRFAETLPDDLYRIDIFGVGSSALRNTSGQAFNDLTNDIVDDGANQTVFFELELGPQVVAVVPQPVRHIQNPTDAADTILAQQRNESVVYFTSDDLFVETVDYGTPTQRLSEDQSVSRLIYTNDTVENTDDVTFLPERVSYDPASDTARLTFSKSLDE